MLETDDPFSWFGKNHNTPDWETSQVGPFDRWPSGLGFDYFYGFMGGDMDQWQPTLYENHQLVPRSTDPDYILTTDLVDKSISWLRRTRSIDAGKPFFLYMATGATHAPHHVHAEYIEKFKGKFDEGWDVYRQQTFARQKKLGVIPPNAQLTDRPAELPAWDTLSADQKRLFARGKMSLYVNGQKVGEGQMKQTQAITLGLGGALDIGEDTGSAVDEAYTPPFRFGGTIQRVTVDLKGK